jgi:hypothetical protein
MKSALRAGLRVLLGSALLAPGACASGSAPKGATTGSPNSSATSGSSSATTSGGATSGSPGPSGSPITPGSPGTADVTFAIDTSQNTHPISPYIYGTNQGDLAAEARGLTLARVGGNRLTAYNWETNASNAGSDYQYENDDFFTKSTVAGTAMKQAAQSALTAGASIIMTVPIAGWVSADENGPCPSKPTQAQIAQRFVPMVAKKPTAFAYPPDTTDGNVYADEFVWWLESQFPTAQTNPSGRIFYVLDNEPDLWSSTHSEIHPSPTTYAELTQKNIAFATSIKAVAPQAIVFGPVNYGWEGYVSLQQAPDANGRDFLSYYLDAMKSADQAAGKRLVDVLDIHWYPEATGDGKRITDNGTTPGEVAARLQAPRSLWDPSYTETSWIAQSLNGPIELLAELNQKIAAHDPGTRLAMSEYSYGAGADISGGLAQADVLGVFGKEGLFSANNWLLDSNSSFIFGAFALYRNYDGAGAVFGDTSVDLESSDIVKTSAYASTSSTSGANVIAVVVNKTSSALAAGITIKHPSMLTTADVYALTAAGPNPQKGAPIAAVAANAFRYTMPAMSATTLVFRP